MWGGNIHPSLKFLASEYHDFPWPENIWKKKKIFFLWRSGKQRRKRRKILFYLRWSCMEIYGSRNSEASCRRCAHRASWTGRAGPQTDMVLGLHRTCGAFHGRPDLQSLHSPIIKRTEKLSIEQKSYQGGGGQDQIKSCAWTQTSTWSSSTAATL